MGRSLVLVSTPVETKLFIHLLKTLRVMLGPYNHMTKVYTLKPLLGSATDRKLNPNMQRLAHEYAMHILQKNQSATWIFSDGSVAGLKKLL